jgi:hypothetical protein
MPRDTVPVTVLARSVDPAAAVVTWLAAIDANDAEWLFNVGDILLAKNTDAGAQDCVLVGAPDSQNRDVDTTRTIVAGGIEAFGPLAAVGWLQVDGMVYVDVDNELIELAVLRGAK